MNAPNFEAVTARAGHEGRGGLLVGLGNKIPKSEFQKKFYPDAASDVNLSQLRAQQAQESRSHRP